MQIGAGATTMVLVGVSAILASDVGDPAALVGLALVAGPIAAGYVVCRIGRLSPYYDAGCGPAIGGAFLGMLTAIPLGFLTFTICADPYQSDDGDRLCILGAIPGIVAGYVLGTAVGATIGWRVSMKHRAAGRAVTPSAPTAPSLADEWPELRRHAAVAGPRGARLTLPLLAFSF